MIFLDEMRRAFWVSPLISVSPASSPTPFSYSQQWKISKGINSLIKKKFQYVGDDGEYFAGYDIIKVGSSKENFGQMNGWKKFLQMKGQNFHICFSSSH